MPEAMKSPVTAICMNLSAAYPRRKKPEILEKSEAILKRITGRRPVGHRGLRASSIHLPLSCWHSAVTCTVPP